MLGELASAWREREYDRALAFFSENVFYADVNNYRFTSKKDLREFFTSEAQDEDCTFHGWLFDEGMQSGVAEYTYSGTNQYHGTVWIELSDEKIARWREYQYASRRPWADFWK
jgi:hypothetical protein